MSRLTVVFLKDTRHVLAALTRADPPASRRAGQRARRHGPPDRCHRRDVGHVIVPVANLDAVTVDDQPEVLLDPQGFQVVEDPQTTEAAHGDERRSGGKHGRPGDLPSPWRLGQGNERALGAIANGGGGASEGRVVKPRPAHPGHHGDRRFPEGGRCAGRFSPTTRGTCTPSCRPCGQQLRPPWRSHDRNQ